MKKKELNNLKPMYRNIYNKAMNGEKLTPKQVGVFVELFMGAPTSIKGLPESTLEKIKDYKIKKNIERTEYYEGLIMEAVKSERYELAAEYRDRINSLK